MPPYYYNPSMSNKNKPLNFNHAILKTQLKVNPLKVLAHQKRPEVVRVAQQQIEEQPVETSITRSITKPIQKTKEPKELPYKTKMCPNGRDCKRQFTCRFAHNQKQLRRTFYKRTKPCMMYQRGMCGLGSACREYHGNFDLKNWNESTYKKSLCEDFEKGNCPKGNMCIKAHGEKELEEYANLEEEEMREQPPTQKTDDSKTPKQIVIQLQSYKPKSYTMTIVEQKVEEIVNKEAEVLGTFDLFTVTDQ